MSGRQKRRQNRRTPKRPAGLQLETASANGKATAIPATLIDFSEYGCGLQTATPLNVGELVTVKNLASANRKNGAAARKAQVAYCQLHDEGVYRSGLAFEEKPDALEAAGPGVLPKTPKLLDQAYAPMQSETAGARPS